MNPVELYYFDEMQHASMLARYYATRPTFICRTWTEYATNAADDLANDRAYRQAAKAAHIVGIIGEFRRFRFRADTHHHPRRPRQ